MSEGFRELQRVWAKRRLPPTPAERTLWLPPAPPWLRPSDPLFRCLTEWEQLYCEGEVVWGMVWIANDVLWKDGAADAPGTVVYSFDPVILQNPSLLEPTLECMNRLRFMPARAPLGFGHYAQLLANDYDRSLQQPVPTMLTEGRSVYSSTVLMYRGHLPPPWRLTLPLLPIVARRGVGHPCVLLPASYWPNELCESWRRAGLAPEL